MITSQLQVEPVLQMAGVGHLGCQARARDGAWMAKLASARVRSRKDGQSWPLAMSEDRPARRVVICTISTLRPAYRTRCRVHGRVHVGARAWMAKLARTRVRARKGGQSWSLAMSEDRPARRGMICTVSTLRPAYLHTAEHSVTAHVCGMQVGRMQRRNRADHDPARSPIIRHG